MHAGMSIILSLYLLLGLVSKEIEKQSIVVFDEAHNIDNICIEALSVTLNKRLVQKCSRNLQAISRQVENMERTDAKRLNDEYKALVEGLADAGTIDDADTLLARPTLTADILEQAVPGNIRRAKHFVMFLRTLVNYLKTRLNATQVKTS